MNEVYRILKPNGKFVVLTPNWSCSNVRKFFYDDFTHKHPFTLEGLKRMFQVYNFKVIYCDRFIQLPFVWKYPYLKWTCKLISLFYYFNTQNKFIKFSSEEMILGIGEKNVAKKS
jgi:SAM-dependent methyltransferase